MSWRITVNDIDRSNTAIPQISNTGAMLIKSAKGPVEPVKIFKGELTRFTDIFGEPSSTYPNSWEAIEYLKKADLWVTAPYESTSKLGGVLVTDIGCVALSAGVDPAAFDSYSFSDYTFSSTDTIGTGDGTTANFTKVLTYPISDPTTDLTIKKDGVDISVTVTDNGDGTYSIASAQLSSGTYTANTKTIDITFGAGNIPGAVDVTAEYTAKADVYFLLTSKSPFATDDLGVIVTYDSNTTYFTIKLYQKNDQGSWIFKKQYEVSLTAGEKNQSGTNVYLETVLEEDDYLKALVNTSETFDSFTDDSTQVAFAGGVRNLTLTSTEYTTAWNYFQQKRTYPAQIFMDVTGDSSIVQLFSTLSSTYQTYSDYIMPLPDNESASTAVSTKNGYSINDPNFAFYWNWGRVQDVYSGTKFYTSLVGRIGGKFADMVNVFNGKAPAGSDEDGVGGQLGSGIDRLRYDPSDSQLETFNDNGINPIIKHPLYGYLIEGQKTGKTPYLISDTSWIAHNRLFNYIKSNIIQLVLEPQITKLNDPAHRQLRAIQTVGIMAPIEGAGLLREYKVQCDENNNTDTILANRQFVLSLAVKVTPFSETITFNFIKTGQTISVEEVLS